MKLIPGACSWHLAVFPGRVWATDQKLGYRAPLMNVLLLHPRGGQLQQRQRSQTEKRQRKG